MSLVLAFSYHNSFVSKAMLEVKALTLRTQIKGWCSKDEHLVLIVLTAESPLENLIPHRRDSCFTTQPMLFVE